MKVCHGLGNENTDINIHIGVGREKCECEWGAGGRDII
jgi:hypothetical protein